jgi:hypothetical protein
MGQAQIGGFAGDAFLVGRIGEYWQLEGRSYLEVFPKLQT